MVSVLKGVTLAAAMIGAVLCGSAVAQTGAQPDVTLQPLEPQSLEVGECGLFLWSREAEPKLMMVAWDKPGMVRLRANERIMTLPRVAFSGENVSGHFEKQRYSDDGLTINVEIEFDETRALRDGAYVKQGVMRMTSRRGWDTVIPVGGLAACQRTAPEQPRSR